MSKNKVFKKTDLLKMSVKKIQDLRSERKLFNVIGMNFVEVDQLILAKLPSSTTLGPFIVELEYYSADNILMKEEIIKKLENALPKIVEHNQICQLPTLNLVIDQLSEDWIKSLLTKVLAKFEEMSYVNPMVVHGLDDAEAGKAEKHY